MKKPYKTSPKILLSGGGTGGHIYPAIAIADELKKRIPTADILFVGAHGKMEMEKVPKADYAIKGLPITGINRGNLLSNLSFPYKLLKSLYQARKIINDFNPDVAIGTGGYASGPVLWAASQKKIPIVIQEQNAFPGITNKILGKKAALICVAYENMDKFFPKEKISLTGNPIRKKLFDHSVDPIEARNRFSLKPDLFTVLSVGGSQGSRKINYAWLENISELIESNIQLIWQTGSLDYRDILSHKSTKHTNIHLSEFIYDMDNAYAAADMVVTRAGAIAISELAAMGKASLLIPLPTAAEDHQTKNAQYLVSRNAGKILLDQEAKESLVKQVIELSKNKNEVERLSSEISRLGKPSATEKIVDKILEIL